MDDFIPDTTEMRSTFSLTFQERYFKKGDIFQHKKTTLIILTKPKNKYSRWYWKLLNKLTFGKFFNYEVSYKVGRL